MNFAFIRRMDRAWSVLVLQVEVTSTVWDS
jgi:hypothetical protein